MYPLVVAPITMEGWKGLKMALVISYWEIRVDSGRVLRDIEYKFIMPSASSTFHSRDFE
jgi:hypothetical protein